jgi:hypothetical protein
MVWQLPLAVSEAHCLPRCSGGCEGSRVAEQKVAAICKAADAGGAVR